MRWPRVTATWIAAATLLAGAGIMRVETAVGYRAFLGADHPVVREFDEFVERFGGGLPLLAVWSCAASAACDGALDERSLRMADAVARRLAVVPAIRRVDSPATSPLLFHPAIGLPQVRTMVRDGDVVAEIDELRRQALRDPAWVRRLVSADGKAGAIALHLRDSASATAEEAYAALREALQPYEVAGYEFAYVGGPVEFVVAAADLQRNSQRIIPLMVAVIAVVLVMLFGTPAPAAVALACVGLAVLWTMGLMGWLGWPQNSLTQILPPLVLVVGVCDAVHLLGRRAGLESGLDRCAAMAQASSDVGRACAATTVTTVAGFGSLAVSGLESIARFGILAAAGVVAALVLTFTALPLLVSRLPSEWFSRRRTVALWSRGLGAVADWSTGAARRAILLAALAAGGLGALGARQVQVEATFEDLYGEESDVVRWAAATERDLRAPDTLEIAVRSPQADGIPPEAFAIADRIQRALAEAGDLGPSLSIVDLMRHLNAMVHRDDLPLGSVADDRGRPASVYRLLRSREPSATDDLVDVATSSLRISVESAKLPQAELRRVLAAVERDVTDELPPGWRAMITGPLAVVGRMIDAIRATQLQSFALAAVLVFAAVSTFFRSLRLGLLAMVPTILPVLVTLGVMGWAGIALDIGSAMVASVILGLAVDDAVHMLSRWRQAASEGTAAAVAVRRAVIESGRAVVTTSLALAVGFSTLSLSAWQSIASFGIIAAIAVLVALLASVVILPALLVRTTFRG